MLLIAEVRKKEQSDIRLNNPDLLRAVVKSHRLGYQKISYSNKLYAKILPHLGKGGKVMKTLVPFIFLRIAVLF